MSQLTENTLVSDIVTAFPQSADLFRNLRIDFCCGGKVTLQTAAQERNLDPAVVLTNVQELAQKRDARDSMHPSSFGNKTLVAYIQEKYHANLREELPLLEPYVAKVARVHGDKHPHLFRVQAIYKTLRAALLEHTDDENQNVFPLILAFFEKPTLELKEQLKPHVFELEEEHDNAGRLLHELRDITDNFTLPEDACNTYRIVYARLEQLEKDTFDHVHLENNVLFDRVRAVL